MNNIKNCRSSSLQQLQSTSQRLERRFSQIEVLIEQGEAVSTIDPPVSASTEELSKMSLLRDGLMKYAEGWGREWSTIGVDDWIEVGKWWLMKVC